jgi:DNA sulfur modification protein DndE
MSVETLRINQRGRTLLIGLKRRTKIENWNILCRWAFCVSLAEKTPPREDGALGDSAVEMTWQTFGGEFAGIYLGLLRQRCLSEGLDPTDAELTKQARLHVFRGLGYLASKKPDSISDLVGLAA